MHIQVEGRVQARQAGLGILGSTRRQQTTQATVQLRGRCCQPLFQQVIGHLLQIEYG